MIKYAFRPAIAMIELIFALVVLGIVLLSAPTLIGVSSKTTSIANYQESITEASSFINLITTRFWDENDYNNTSPILSSAPNQFPGMVDRTDLEANGSRLPATAIFDDNNSENDMDDFNGKDYTLTLAIAAQNATAGVNDYLDFNVTLNAQVQYGKAGLPGDEPFSNPLGGVGIPNPIINTKVISVVLTSDNFPDKAIRLSTFACNIGSFRVKSTGENR